MARATCWSPPTGRSSGSGRPATPDPWAAATAATRADVPPVAAIALTPDANGLLAARTGRLVLRVRQPPEPDAVGDRPRPSSRWPTARSDTDPDRGTYCNPYGPCEEWCALFATWVWQHAGVPIPSYPFTGSIYDWAASNTGVLPPTAAPSPGDAVLYGTGPVVDRDLAPRRPGHAGLAGRGHRHHRGGRRPGARTARWPWWSTGPTCRRSPASYNGMPIYAFAVP